MNQLQLINPRSAVAITAPVAKSTTPAHGEQAAEPDAEHYQQLWSQLPQQQMPVAEQPAPAELLSELLPVSTEPVLAMHTAAPFDSSLTLHLARQPLISSAVLLAAQPDMAGIADITDITDVASPPEPVMPLNVVAMPDFATLQPTAVPTGQVLLSTALNNGQLPATAGYTAMAQAQDSDTAALLQLLAAGAGYDVDAPAQQAYTISNTTSTLLNAAQPGADHPPATFIGAGQTALSQAGTASTLLADMATGINPAVSGAQVSATGGSETVFQWKAEQLGVQSSQWGQKLLHLLSDKINLQLGQQIQRAQIRLDPPQLGMIELTVSIDADRTSVQLYASNNQMRDAMQQNLEQLRQQLAQRLGHEQPLDIDVRDKPAQQHKQQQPDDIAGHVADDEQTTAAAAVTTLSTDRLNRLV